MSEAAVPPGTAPSAVATATGDSCPNCLAPLHGAYCYACGQPRKGNIRPLVGIVADFLDTVFNVDARIWRTLGPLYLKPGFLSNEYFAGRRVRYVTPLRLYFFLSIVAFLLIKTFADIDQRDPATRERATVGATGDADERRERAEQGLRYLPAGVREEVRAELERELARELAADAAREAANQGPPEGPASTTRAPAAAPAAPAPPAAPGARDDRTRAERRVARGFDKDEDGPPSITFGNGKPWHRTDNPLQIGWLGDGLNAALNDEIGELLAKLDALKDDPSPFFEELFSIAPQALFFILPLFALLLKLFYAFKRRLYMEHMIVALHSHSFLCLSLLVIMGLGLLQDWVDGITVLEVIVGIATAAATLWVPLYLLLMQRRVYRQNWLLTLFKYVVFGVLYSVLLALGLLLSLLVSLIFV